MCTVTMAADHEDPRGKEQLFVWMTIIWCGVAIWPVYKWVAVAQGPYFAWVSIATVLQISITWMNWGKA